MKAYMSDWMLRALVLEASAAETLAMREAGRIIAESEPAMMDESILIGKRASIRLYTSAPLWWNEVEAAEDALAGALAAFVSE